jgi:hypothetical protein
MLKMYLEKVSVQIVKVHIGLRGWAKCFYENEKVKVDLEKGQSIKGRIVRSEWVKRAERRGRVRRINPWTREDLGGHRQGEKCSTWQVIVRDK